ncbi:hypothetical protein EYF80_025628 [Liparis tanakae]|uniref:Uncharacterized protein n=1 Tax=Liparis tanakae TaxID=230148 RepID=A0A4Z2HF02_9TELE|nr:hypothetical protein EYF80_025628 [Liparis tanakae]
MTSSSLDLLRGGGRVQTGSPPAAGHGSETAAWLDRESSCSSSDGCSSSDQTASSGSVFTAMLTEKKTKLLLALRSCGSPAGRERVQSVHIVLRCSTKTSGTSQHVVHSREEEEEEEEEDEHTRPVSLRAGGEAARSAQWDGWSLLDAGWSQGGGALELLEGAGVQHVEDLLLRVLQHRRVQLEFPTGLHEVLFTVWRLREERRRRQNVRTSDYIQDGRFFDDDELLKRLELGH